MGDHGLQHNSLPCFVPLTKGVDASVYLTGIVVNENVNGLHEQDDMINSE